MNRRPGTTAFDLRELRAILGTWVEQRHLAELPPAHEGNPQFAGVAHSLEAKAFQLAADDVRLPRVRRRRRVRRK
jgi:hypothetical protein